MPITATIMSIAEQFVDLVIKYGQWKEVKTLPEDEVKILFDIVSVAGFNPKKVVSGTLVGHCCDQDGSRTGETYPINKLCPFKVLDEAKNEDHYFATGWLDCALRCVVYGFTQCDEDRDKLINIIVKEIERSIPLTPIQLTKEGDLLCEYPPIVLAFGMAYFVEHTKDNREINDCIGIHKLCGGWIHRKPATNTHDVLVCRECHLRVLFPIEVNTYGDLRQALSLTSSSSG